ncbi:Ig-like domain-containing protein [Pseudoalteromonas sp. JSTW]|uniref:Ig-like domain-containing protein n=1 Tax=Pseudoalteromonas sp. JSTW TaxID=2752475 RepID=UPI0015D565B7|nr:Ig-like domain-containing protein [Pseudoalteromonas sp. JSTW]QLJ10407.1 cadherin-like domain-containing protein [Pseudoalteromonas sp. JSTW]
MRNLKRSTITLMIMAGVLAGCNDSDNDDKDDMKPVPVNQAPSATDAMVTTQTEVVIEDMLEGSDPEGDALTYSLVSEPTLGSVVVQSDGSYTYTPNAETTGADSFEFAVSDGVNSQVTATVSITIEALQVDFAAIGRAAFNQAASDEPLRLNGRVFLNTGAEANFDDLVTEN